MGRLEVTPLLFIMGKIFRPRGLKLDYGKKEFSILSELSLDVLPPGQL